MSRILIADDDVDTCRYIRQHLLMERDLNKEIDHLDVVHDRDKALQLLAEHQYAVLIVDLWMPDSRGKLDREAGMKILEQARTCRPQPEAILITGHSSLDSVLRASGLGALDYVLRPIDYAHLLDLIRQGLDKFMSHSENQSQDILLDGEAFIGSSQPMIELMKEVGRIAHTNADVLLVGESGTGKDMMARAIHRNSPRRNKPFVPVNCSAIPAELIEAELFGIQSRVATDVDAREGKFQEADGGILFLDEIGEISMSVQPKLLRALDTKEIQPVGGSTKRVDVRILAATNRDLRAAVADKDFRADLYFRISGVSIHLPPLRERREDIRALVEHFMGLYRHEFKKGFIGGMSPDVWHRLSVYDWPGNVRELERAIKYAVATCNKKTISTENLPSEISRLPQESSAPNRPMGGSSDRSSESIPLELLGIPVLKEAVSHFERIYLDYHLRQNQWNVKQTATQLGIARQVLHRKIKQYDLHR